MRSLARPLAHRLIVLASFSVLPLTGCGGELYLNADDAVTEFDPIDRDGGDQSAPNDDDLTGDGDDGSGGDFGGGDNIVGDGFGGGDDGPEPCGFGGACPSGQECIEGGCVQICGEARCGTQQLCCAFEGNRTECASGRCQVPCPRSTDVRCGTEDQLCCDVTANQVCGASLTCVQNCTGQGPLCGNGTAGSFGSVCCDGRSAATTEDDDVCVFDKCVARGAECQSFLDCNNGEYCELTLHEETMSGEPDTGYCLPNEFPPDAPVCQSPPDDTFAPQTEWSWVGIQLVGTSAADVDFNGFTDGQVIPKCATASDLNCYREPCTEIPSTASPVQTTNFQRQCFRNVAFVPVTADLDGVDHDPDPAVQKFVPEVVFKAYADDANTFNNKNVLVIADGRSDAELPSTGTPSKQQRSKIVVWGAARGHAAIGNLDNDPQLEIATGNLNGLCVYDAYVDQGGSPPTTAVNAKKWCSAAGALNVQHSGSAPHFADFDGDGVAEIIIGGTVARHDGATGTILVDVGFTGDSVSGTRCNATTECFALTTVADVNGDGLPDLLAGDKAWTIRRNPTNVIGVERITGVDGWVADRIWSASYAVGSTPQPWTIGQGRGYPGVANFVDNTKAPYNRPTDTPEVAYVYDGGVYIVSGETGVVIRSPVAGSTQNLAFKYLLARGGPPNIADFDGDGRPEVSFAGTGCMVVMDPDCAANDATGRAALANTAGSGCNVAVPTGSSPPQRTCTIDVQPGIADEIGILWQYQTQDQSSAVTGTSVFDFQGDGKAEVLYNDECFFRVFDGATSEIIYERPSSNRTITEYPIVVDVDGDSNSEIVITSNGDQSSLYTSGRDRCGGPLVGTAESMPNCAGLTASGAAACLNNGGCGWTGSACVTCSGLATNVACDPVQFGTISTACTARTQTTCFDQGGGCGLNAANACVACSVLNTNGLCTAASGCSWTGSACVTAPNCTNIKDGSDSGTTLVAECNATTGCFSTSNTGCFPRINGCGWNATAGACQQDCSRVFDGTDGNTNFDAECNASRACKSLLGTCKTWAYRNDFELYKASSCTCGDHTQQADCDAARGCRWNGSTCTVVTGANTAGNCGSYPDRDTCQQHIDDCLWDPFQGGAGACEENPRGQAFVCMEATWGVTTYGDTSDQWVKTLPYWFEHPYHITNQDRFGRVIPDWSTCFTGSQCAAQTDAATCEETFVSGSSGPVCQFGEPNTDFYNNFRQNVPGFVPLNAPDLRVDTVVADLRTCPPTVKIIARVVNKGRAGISKTGVKIGYYRLGDEAQTYQQTIAGVSGSLQFALIDLPVDLLPGSAVDLLPQTYPISSNEAPINLDFRVIANPDFITNPSTSTFECNAANNFKDVLNIDCTGTGG